MNAAQCRHRACCRFRTSCKAVLAGLMAAAFLLPSACASSGQERPPARGGNTLAVYRFPGHERLGSFRLPADGDFSLTFIHSVSRTPVRDDYRAVAGRIVQTDEVYEALGAGLPYGPEETGATGWEERGGKFIIHLRRPIGRLIVRTDRNYRNRLLIGKRQIDLNQWEDQALELVVEPDGTSD